MTTRHTFLVAGLALVLGACSHPGSMGGGPAMMGGYSHGGMMDGRCSYGPGMGMQGSFREIGSALEQLDLSPDQRTRIAAIHDELHQRHWVSMQAMHDQGGPVSVWSDEAALRQRFERMSVLHQQMFDHQLEAQRRILEVLTPAQRAQLTARKSGG